MKKYILMLVVAALLPAVALFAQDSLQVANEGSGSNSGMDPFEMVIFLGYFVSVLVLLPIVVYTNLKEGLFDPEIVEPDAPISGMDEEERNDAAEEILERIEDKLTPFKDENGNEMITITKGSQAKFMKRGLDYINKKLQPTDPLIKARVNEFAEVYEDRAARAFTGSWWIIVCSAGVGALMVGSGGFSTFIVIHFLGLLFYVLSSRTTMYGIEKRMKAFKFVPGIVGGIMGGLFLGGGTKYYMKSGSGPWKRDWETEGQMAMIGLMIMAIVALVLGFLAAVLGVLNFVFNYSTSFLLPIKSDQKWYEENFKLKAESPALEEA